MSSTPEPSAGQTPSKLQFAESGDDGDNMNTKLVALIVVVIVLIAAGVTAAVVFGKKETTTQTPPQPGPPGQIVGMPLTAPTPHGMPAVVALMSSGMPLAGETMLAVSGKPVEVVEGVSITPADGWTVDTQDKGLVILMNADKTAMLFVAAGVTDSKDAAQVLDADIQKFVEENGLANTKVTKPKTGTLDSKNFQEVVSRGFTGDLETQQGTINLVGMFAELMNTSTGMSAFIVFNAPSEDDYDAAADDADSMIGSLL
jgi:hypothetical protein